MAKAKTTAKKAIKPKKHAVKKATATPKKAATKAKPTTKKKTATTPKNKDILPNLKPSEIYCAFCDNSPKDCRALLCSSTKVFICDECIAEFNHVLYEKDFDYWSDKLLDLFLDDLANIPIKKKSKKETK